MEDLTPLQHTNLQSILAKIESIHSHLPVKEFYTSSEFATKLGIDKQLVVKYCNEGKLKAVQMGTNNSWMIKVSELDRLNQMAEANKSPYREVNINILRRAKPKSKAA